MENNNVPLKNIKKKNNINVPPKIEKLNDAKCRRHLQKISSRKKFKIILSDCRLERRLSNLQIRQLEMKKIVHSEESNLKRINSEKKDYLKSVKVRKSTCAKPSLARDEILEKCFDAGTNAKAFSGEVNPKTDEKTSNVEPKHYQKPKYLEEISKYENTSNEPIISTFVVPEKLIIKNFNRINVKI